MAGMILSIITFLPAVAALILLVFLRDDDEAAANNARWVALIATVITFVASLLMLGDFDPQNTGFQLVHEAEWVMGLTYKLGVDGISILFVMLTTFMMPLVIYASWGVTTRVKEYMVAFLLLETLMLGVFMALDLVLFYLFFEAGLIPMFLIIGIWGWQKPHLCIVQILPLYAIGFGSDADRDDRNVCGCRHSRYSNIDDTSIRV